MHRLCGLRHAPNFLVLLVADSNFYLRLTAEKMEA